jgi:hypothetical protein
MNTETSTLKGAPVEANIDLSGSKDALVKQVSDKLNNARKSDDEPKGMATESDVKDEFTLKSKSNHRVEACRERDRIKSRGRDRGWDSDKEREREEAERFKLKDHGHRSRERAKDSGSFIDLKCGCCFYVSVS